MRWCRPVIFLLCIVAMVTMTMATRIKLEGLIKPISHELCPHLRLQNHRVTICSRSQMGMLLGRWRSSRKNIREDTSKNPVKKGVKSMVDSGLTNERGNPHTIKKGNDIKEIKSCSWMLFRNQRRHALYLFI